jgi:hypothetical protein
MRKNMICAGDKKDPEVLTKVSPRAKAAIENNIRTMPFALFLLVNIKIASIAYAITIRVNYLQSTVEPSFDFQV